MIRLNKLELKNFLSHSDTSLSLNDHKGLVLIEGKNNSGFYSSNGSGKSTLLEGIVYALTGDTLRGVSVNDVINRNAKKNTKASLQFTKDDQEEYTVSRYRKDDDHGDSIVLLKGAEDISKRVNKETQQLLDDTLNISYKVLVSTMLLGEGLSSRFTQLSDPEKKSLIESTLNLNYDIAAIRAKANTSMNSKKLDLSNVEGRLSALKELNSLDIEELQKAVEESDLLLTKSSEQETAIRSSLAELQSSRAPLENKRNLLMQSINSIDTLTRELTSLDNEASRYTSELENMEKAECPHCTVCHQELKSGESKEAFRATYAEKITVIQNRMFEIRSQLDSLPNREILDTKLAEVNSELSGLDTNIIQKNNELSVILSEKSNAQYNRDSASHKIDQYNSSHANIGELETTHHQLSDEITKYDYFYKLFSPTGIIINILSEAVDYINGRLSTYSEILLEKDYKISFVKGKISLVDGKGSSYQSLSNGEKRRLDISIQLSLHDYVHKYCGIGIDTLSIDEVLDTLDDIGVENIFDVLRLKLEYCGLKSIYVITHNDALKSKFDDVITVVKDSDGNSRLI